MIKVALRGLFGRKLRAVLTAIAIVLGTAMISGTFVVRDQISNAFSDIFTNVNKGKSVILSRKPAFDQSQTQVGPIPASLIDKVRSVPGVAVADGQIQALGSIVVNGKYISNSTGAPNLVFSALSPPLDPSTHYVEGHAPSASGDIVVGQKLFQDQHLKIGQKVGLATEKGVVPVTVVGAFTLAGVGSIGGATLVGTTFSDAQYWFDRQGQTSLILVAADKGVNAEDLKHRIQQVVPSYVRVQTGTENAQSSSNSVTSSINGFLTPLLLAFAGAAVFVGAFIIFNTFSITVAQRMRELATLRTLGATRRQVMRSVLLEAFVMGLIASVIGILAGIGFAKLLDSLFSAVGFGLPTAPITISWESIVIPLIVGVGVALLSALPPALRATRVPPVAVLREGAELPPSRFSKYTPVVAAIIGILGLALILSAVFGNASGTQVLLSLAGGAILCFIAVAMVSRYLVPPLASVIGWPMERLTRLTGRLARENTMRNPGRTAVTAAALMVGVGLVVFVAVFVNGFKTTFLDAIDKSVSSQLIISANGGAQLPSDTASAAAGVPGVQAAAPLQITTAKINSGGTDELNGIDPQTFPQTYRFVWRDGASDALLQNFHGTDALVEKQFASDHHLKTGSAFSVESVDGNREQLHVVGIYKDPVLMTGVTIPAQTFDGLVKSNDPSVLLVRFQDGADATTVTAAVKQALKPFPAAKVQTNAEYKASFEKQINQFLALLYILLAMSVIISLFGIVNTLALSVFERTREIGMLRAVGMGRWQLRWVITDESVITAIIGGLLGIAIGIVFAWIVNLGLSSQGIQFSIPYSQLIACLIVAVIVGLVAAIMPARRAAKLNVLEALQYE